MLTRARIYVHDYYTFDDFLDLRLIKSCVKLPENKQCVPVNVFNNFRFC